MHTSLDHLPEHKRDELRAVAEFIRDTVAVEMLILFGSYARGDWVEELADDGVHYKYQSDYDLLVIVKDASLADRSGYWLKVERDARRLARTPVALIAHDIDFVNRRLRKGQYFFSDIKKEGVLLFDAGRFELAEPNKSWGQVSHCNIPPVGVISAAWLGPSESRGKRGQVFPLA